MYKSIIMLLLAAILTTTTNANATRLYKPDELVKVAQTKNLTAYAVKYTKVPNSDGSIEFVALTKYTAAGQKVLFANTKAAKRPDMTLVTYNVLCSENKMKVTHTVASRNQYDLIDDSTNTSFAPIEAGTVEAAWAKAVCSPDFE